MRTLSLLVCVAALLGACTLQTAGGPKGERSFRAVFDDVQHLVPGHSVRVSDVPVGTVTGVGLDGYDAVVEFTVVDDRPLPVGTTASISSTSLLGENYLRLTFPDALSGQELADGAELPTAGADASFEELTLQLLAVTRSIQGRDVSTVVNAGAEALGGRGTELNGLLVTVEEIGDGLVEQKDDFDALLVQLADLGSGLAPAADEIARTVELAADAAGSIAVQRDRLVATFDDLTTAAVTLDEEVLTPHRAELDRIIDDLTPVVSTLTADVDTVIDGLQRLVVFNENIPKATGGGELAAFGIFDEYQFGGRTVPGPDAVRIIEDLLTIDPADPLGPVVGTIEDLLGLLGGAG